MKYHIARFRVRDDALELVMGVTKKGEVEGIEFIDLIPDVDIPAAKVKRHSYTNGKKNKGVTGIVLMLSKLPATMDELKTEFVNHGFAASSAEAVASKLKAHGKVIRDKNFKYHLAK